MTQDIKDLNLFFEHLGGREQAAKLNADEFNWMFEGWKLARKAQEWRPFDSTRSGIFLVRVPNSRNAIQVANFTGKINMIGHHFDFDFETPDLMMDILQLPK